MAGVQSFLAKLSPSVDYVGIEVFPGVTSASAQYDVSNCSSHSVTPVEYGISGFSGSSPTDTYTIVGLATVHHSEPAETAIGPPTARRASTAAATW